MNLQTERQQTFARGMNSLAGPSEFQGDELGYLFNGDLSLDGQAVSPRAGTKQTHAAALNSGAQGYGGAEFHTAAGAQQIVVFVGNKMFTSTDDGVNWTEQATGLRTDYWSLAIMRVGAANYLCCVNGGTTAYYWDGATWGALANVPSGSRFCAVFNDRLYVSGHDGSKVGASAVGAPTNWTIPQAFEVNVATHDGDVEIRGLFVLGASLLVFKRQSLNYIDGFGYQTLVVEAGARGVSRSVGCVAHRTIRAVGDQSVCWLSERGIETYTLGGAIDWVSRPLQPQIDELAWDNILADDGLCHAVYLPIKNEYRLAAPSDGNTATDRLIVFRPATTFAPPALWLANHMAVATVGQTVYVGGDSYLAYQADATRDPVKVSGGYLTVVTSGGQYVLLSSGYLILASATSQHAVMFTADRTTAKKVQAPWAVGMDGFVRHLDVGTKDDVASDDSGGTSVALTIRSRPFLFGDQFRKKKARVVRVHSKQAAASTVDVQAMADGVYGTSHAQAVGAVSSPKSTKVRTRALGDALQVEVRTSDDVEIHGLEVAAEMLRTAW